jgi:hypothetical protein
MAARRRAECDRRTGKGCWTEALPINHAKRRPEIARAVNFTFLRLRVAPISKMQNSKLH